MCDRVVRSRLIHVPAYGCRPSRRSQPGKPTTMRAANRWRTLLSPASSSRVASVRLYKPSPQLLAASLTVTTTFAATRRASYSTTAMSSFYELKPQLPNGKTYDFGELKGKVVLIVNVASKWYVQTRFQLVCRAPLNTMSAAVSLLSTKVIQSVSLPEQETERLLQVSRPCMTSTRRRDSLFSASHATRCALAAIHSHRGRSRHPVRWPRARKRRRDRRVL